MTGLYVLKFEPEQLTICEGDSVLVNGDYESTSGVYITTVSDSTFIEDILVTELEILSNSYSLETLNLTVGDSVLIGMEYYSQDGIYSYSIENSVGCDSIITFNLSFAVGVNEMNFSKDLSLYPNPFSSSTLFKFENPEQSQFSLEVYNTQGAIVRTTSDIRSDEFIFQKEDLSTGIYFFHLYSMSRHYQGMLLIEE